MAACPRLALSSWPASWELGSQALLRELLSCFAVCCSAWVSRQLWSCWQSSFLSPRVLGSRPWNCHAGGLFLRDGFLLLGECSMWPLPYFSGLRVPLQHFNSVFSSLRWRKTLTTRILARFWLKCGLPGLFSNLMNHGKEPKKSVF